MPEFSNQFPSECSTYLDDDADTVVTTTDVGHGYTDDGALSLQSAEAEGGRQTGLYTLVSTGWSSLIRAMSLTSSQSS